MTKKEIRANFRQACFTRDKHRCVMCGKTEDLAAHHITDRNEMPSGGYVAENGITVCPDCHLKAERRIISPDDLYRKIGSSKEQAVSAAKRLADVA